MKQFLNVLEHMTIIDVLDIVVVAIIVYQFLAIIRGTRAVQMVLGIFALMLLFAFSVKYRFYSLNWVLSHFFDSFFLIIIILFQDHIRAALVSVGGATSWGTRSESDQDQEIEEVVNAVNALSKEKTGALIVFEKKNGLLNYMQTGTRLSALLHSDFLYTLFQSNSPLHDGAVIISSGRLEAAGCFLPLSRNLDFDNTFGTRHRAAIGITEDTDAISITVSEETGKINLFTHGHYYPIKNVNELRVSLSEHLKSL